MTTIADAVEIAALWAEELVAPRILLKQAPPGHDLCDGAPEMVHPRVYRMFAPCDQRALPDGAQAAHPSITVTASSTAFPYQCRTEYSLAFHIATWSPGRHPSDYLPPEPGALRRDADGWADCYAVADLMTAELRRCHVMGGRLDVDLSRGVRVEPYSEQGAIVDLWPYFYCRVELAASAGSPPVSDPAEFL